VKLFPARLLGLFAFALMFLTLAGHAMASGTDINGTVSDLGTLWTTIQTLAIGVILFVLGRKLLKKV